MRTGEAANRTSDCPLDILLKESVFLFYAIPGLFANDVRVANILAALCLLLKGIGSPVGV
ncbi:hypothetical protein PanWU01x14_323170 [Parasponia andersonii]|uniref:Uncharacterized protein n=1 Tax=Parasponia andersonii TaxID=3476 RepID=A0A2P5AKJ9_PARAD|nr:hypothetical protein PanWU01x14_323170 [Parasponia andersonii]